MPISVNPSCDLKSFDPAPQCLDHVFPKPELGDAFVDVSQRIPTPDNLGHRFGNPCDAKRKRLMSRKAKTCFDWRRRKSWKRVHSSPTDIRFRRLIGPCCYS